MRTAPRQPLQPSPQCLLAASRARKARRTVTTTTRRTRRKIQTSLCVPARRLAHRSPLQDIEFIIDPNAPAPAPSRSISYAPQARPAQPAEQPAAPAPAPEVAARPAAVPETPVAAPPTPVPVPAAAAAPAEPAAADETPTDLPPEGPPPSAPQTAPPLTLSPSGAALQYPPTDEALDGPEKDAQQPLTVYQVDLASFPDKPWRRPGADLTDWFNYGFDEHTWALWCAKKNQVDQERTELQDKAPEGMLPFMQGMMPGASAPDTGAPGGMPDMSAMFGPGAMMGMQPMQQMMQAMMGGGGGAPGAGDAMPPGMPDPASMGMAFGAPPAPGGAGEGAGAPMDTPAEAASTPRAERGDASPAQDAGMPRVPGPWSSGQHPLPPVPQFALPPEGDAHGDGGHGGGHSRGGRRSGKGSAPPARGANSYGQVGAGWSGRRHRGGPYDAYDEPPSDPRAGARRYNDRDTANGAGDALDYGGGDPRRPPPPYRDDERHSRRDDDHHSRGGRSRRERERARSDRRSGRGGQKRGAPDGEEDRDMGNKRFYDGSRAE